MTTTILLSPSETALAERFKDEAITSSLPEQKGADILIYSKLGLFGIQRKEIPHDFISSITDGRMARETSLLAQSCQFRRLVCEGRFRFYPDQRLVVSRKSPTRFTKNQIRGMLLDISLVKGVEVDYTEDIDDTVLYIRSLVAFMSRSKHLSLYTRPSAQGAWFTPTGKDIELWLLQAFPGIGPTTADAIISHFGGKAPLRWSCTEDELRQVPKLGAKRAKVLIESLHGVQDSSANGLMSRIRGLK